MHIHEFTPGNGNRQAGSIRSHPDSKIPARFAPSLPVYSAVAILDGVEKLGTMVVSKDEIHIYAGTVNTPFTATNVGAIGGIRQSSLQWILPVP